MEKIITFNQREFRNVLDGSSDSKIDIGKLFSDSSGRYAYFFNTKSGSHLLFRFIEKTQVYEKIFEFEGGVDSQPARFIDCNFDSVKDILVQVESGGNFDEELRLIFLKKGDQFIEVTKPVSFPIFDNRSNEVISRYQGPNDSTITIEKYTWDADTLKLINTIKVNDLDYIETYGNLVFE